MSPGASRHPGPLRWNAGGEVADQFESLAGLEERCADAAQVEPAGGVKARGPEAEVEVVPVDVGDRSFDWHGRARVLDAMSQDVDIVGATPPG